MNAEQRRTCAQFVDELTRGMTVGKRDTVIIRVGTSNPEGFAAEVYAHARSCFPRNRVVVTYAENLAAVIRPDDELDARREAELAREREWSAKQGGDRP